MRLNLRFGRTGKLGRLKPEQEAVLKRLEDGEITEAQATAELGGSVRTWKWSFGTGADEAAVPSTEAAAEPIEDDPARELVERIAREVDAES